MKTFSENVIRIISQIPAGRVMTYGNIALLSGNINAARQVSYVLRKYSSKYNLPWHRVVNSKGGISLKDIEGRELQKLLLEDEGVVFENDRILDFESIQYIGD